MLYRTTTALTIAGTIYRLIAPYVASQPQNKGISLRGEGVGWGGGLVYFVTQTL